MAMRRATKPKNLSSARYYDQFRFRFHTTKTLSEHKVRKNALALLTTSNTVFCCICKPLNQLGAVTTVLSADRKTR